MKKIPVRHIAATQQEIAAAGLFKIRSIQALLAGKDLFHELHRHDFFFVLAVQKGGGLHEIDFVSYEVNDHSIFVIRPGQVHQLELKADCTGFLMEFDNAFYRPGDTVANQRLARSAHKNVCVFEQEGMEKLLSVLNTIFHEFNEKQEAFIEVIKASLDIFFIEFIRQSKHEPAVKTGSSYTQERLEDFQELLSRHITSCKQVSQYADMLHLSLYQLNAITKSVLDKPASVLINEHIILEAKRYLLATPNQVKDIADHLGYEDISYFIRFFKKHTGQSPEAFRKKFQ